MKVFATAIPDVLVIEPKVFGDARGFFLESFNQRAFNEAVGSDIHFVQDNHSRSSKGVLRGLHFQLLQPQGKLVRVVRGAVFDVAVDIRRDSPTFGTWAGVELTEDNQRQLWIPPGLAHGFLVLSDVADFLYKTTDYYAPAHERCIAWNDPDLAIHWPDVGQAPQLSGKDSAAPGLAEIEGLTPSADAAHVPLQAAPRAREDERLPGGH
jgi:dTDP-4-dehydrorhamnose 3,5-epimerase